MKEQEDEPITNYGIVNNISGNGLRFTSSNELDANDRILCNLSLDGSPLDVEGEIINKDVYENTFEYRVKLVNLKQSQQQLIVQYVMEKERSMILRDQIGSNKLD